MGLNFTFMAKKFNQGNMVRQSPSPQKWEEQTSSKYEPGLNDRTVGQALTSHAADLASYMFSKTFQEQSLSTV